MIIFSPDMSWLFSRAFKRWLHRLFILTLTFALAGIDCLCCKSTSDEGDEDEGEGDEDEGDEDEGDEDEGEDEDEDEDEDDEGEDEGEDEDEEVGPSGAVSDE